MHCMCFNLMLSWEWTRESNKMPHSSIIPEKEGRLIDRPWNVYGSGNSLGSAVLIGSWSFSSNGVVKKNSVAENEARGLR